jgi:hypothetical protein
MPSLFVVGAEKNLKELTPTLIRARTAAAKRDAALEAIVRANPHLDFDRLTPGDVVVLPPVEGVKKSADEPVSTTADDLVQRLRDGMEALARAAELAEEARAQEKKDAQDVLGSAMVKRLSATVPELSANVESVRATFKQDDLDARRALSDLRASLETWTADLDALHGLA